MLDFKSQIQLKFQMTYNQELLDRLPLPATSVAIHVFTYYRRKSI